MGYSVCVQGSVAGAGHLLGPSRCVGEVNTTANSTVQYIWAVVQMLCRLTAAVNITPLMLRDPLATAFNISVSALSSVEVSADVARRLGTEFANFPLKAYDVSYEFEVKPGEVGEALQQRAARLTDNGSTQFEAFQASMSNGDQIYVELVRAVVAPQLYDVPLWSFLSLLDLPLAYTMQNDVNMAGAWVAAGVLAIGAAFAICGISLFRLLRGMPEVAAIGDRKEPCKIEVVEKALVMFEDQPFQVGWLRPAPLLYDTEVVRQVLRPASRRLAIHFPDAPHGLREVSAKSALSIVMELTDWRSAPEVHAASGFKVSVGLHGDAAPSWEDAPPVRSIDIEVSEDGSSAVTLSRRSVLPLPSETPRSLRTDDPGWRPPRILQLENDPYSRTTSQAIQNAEHADSGGTPSESPCTAGSGDVSSTLGARRGRRNRRRPTRRSGSRASSDALEYEVTLQCG